MRCNPSLLLPRSVGTDGSTVKATYDFDDGNALQLYGVADGGGLTEAGSKYQFSIPDGPRVKLGTSYSPKATDKVKYMVDVDHLAQGLKGPGGEGLAPLAPKLGASVTQSTASLRTSLSQPLTDDLSVGLGLELAKDHARGSPITKAATAQTSYKLGDGTLVGKILASDKGQNQISATYRPK